MEAVKWCCYVSAGCGALISKVLLPRRKFPRALFCLFERNEERKYNDVNNIKVVRPRLVVSIAPTNFELACKANVKLNMKFFTNRRSKFIN